MSNIDSEADLFLRSGTKIEPLCCGWYAWGHLIPPIQRAINITFRYLPLLESFVANPSIHEAAAMDPTLLGAPFVQLSRANVAQIASLAADTSASCDSAIQLAQALLTLSRRLQESARGHSLEALYQIIPPCLAGLVELVYDLGNQPGIRINEELSVDTAPDRQATQQIALFATPDRERHFFLNTPRLASPERLLLPLPFADERLDLITASRIRPTASRRLLEELQVPATEHERFLHFFSTLPAPRKQPDYTGDDVRIRYFGHACVLIQTSTVSVLIDPLLACAHEDEEAVLCLDDLPDCIDYVFLTHNHQDHLCPEILLQLRSRIGQVLVPRNNPANLADPSMKLTLRLLGFDNITVLDPMEAIAIPDGKIVSLPFYGEHADLSIQSKHGMYLALKGRTFAFLADSNCLDRILYRRLRERLGRIDTLFIGMECQGAPLTWLYNPYLACIVKRKDDESRRLSGSDSERAWAVLEEIGSSRVFVYAMGQEPWLQYLCGLRYTEQSRQLIEARQLIERCRDTGIEAERLYGCREMVL
jgi:L-ascorbate metabolism protein UlaG (beta-lactamase superfamily)